MIKHSHYENSIEDVKYQYRTVINLPIGNIQSRNYRQSKYKKTSDEFSKRLSRNSCGMCFINEWISLQHHVIATAAKSPNEHCSRIFMNYSFKGE